MLVAQIPRRYAGTEHRPVVLFGGGDQAGVLFGVELFVGVCLPVGTQIPGAHPLQVRQLCDHCVRTILAGPERRSVTVMLFIGVLVETGVPVAGPPRGGRIDPVEARFSATTTDGTDFRWQGGFIALGIGNGRQAGGGQALCPDARIDDGLLDLTIVPGLEGEVGATLGTVLAEGRHAALDRVAVRARLPWIEIEADAPMVLNLDGEPVEGRRFRAEAVAGRLRMHLPDDCALLSPPDADPSHTEPR